MPKLGEKILKPSLSIGISPSEANSTKKWTPKAKLDRISRKFLFSYKDKHIEYGVESSVLQVLN